MNGSLPAIATELIEDRSLEKAADDRLDHKHFVDELENLVVAVRPPTNIAVFAPWGSGKSSLCNLLESKLSKQSKGTLQFVRFDAFKFAEESLSRHFLSQIADQLGIKTDQGGDYSDELYRKVQTRSVDPKATKLGMYALGALGVFLVLMGLTLLVGLLISWVHGDGGPSTGKVESDALKAFVSDWGPAVALISIFVSVLLQKFTATYDYSNPSGKEEFAREFKKIRKKVDTEKLVIFVDELDRCRSTEVVATLETLKTFLDVRPCVFVVAADRNVIESALQEEARQETPVDSADPYYSSGTSYLDKIFQFQLNLPPLKPHALSEFATGLTGDRAGIWAKLNDQARDDVVSIVLPTHVINPRRAKVLLNAFLMNYRVIEASWRKEMDGSAEKRVREIAKLSTLKNEFPVFYMDLVRHDGLISAVLLLDDNPGAKIPNKELKKIAEKYARDGSAAATRFIPKKTPENAEMVEAMTAASNDQLIQYLRKTESAPGPRSDLIYLEPVSRGFDIPETTAIDLEASIRNNDSRVVELVQSLDQEKRLESLKFIASLISKTRTLVGVELRNAIAACFRASYAAGNLDANTADVVMRSLAEKSNAVRLTVSPPEGESQVDTSGSVGAYRIARATTRKNEARPFISMLTSAQDVGFSEIALPEAIRTWALLDEDARRYCTELVMNASGRYLTSQDDVADAIKESTIAAVATLEHNERLGFFTRCVDAAEDVDPNLGEDDSWSQEATDLFRHRVLGSVFAATLKVEKAADSDE